VLIDGFLALSASRRADAADAATPTTTALQLQAALPPRDPEPAAIGKVIYSVEDVDVAPPAVVSQVVPSVPDAIRPELLRAGRPLVITVDIDPSGRVQKVSVVVPVNPLYDEMVVSSASRWRYKPATRRGVPVPYQKVIAIALR
jgi:TonB family protein